MSLFGNIFGGKKPKVIGIEVRRIDLGKHPLKALVSTDEIPKEVLEIMKALGGNMDHTGHGCALDPLKNKDREEVRTETPATPEIPVEEQVEAKVREMLNKPFEQAKGYLELVGKKGDEATLIDVAVAARLASLLGVKPTNKKSSKKPVKKAARS